MSPTTRSGRRFKKNRRCPSHLHPHPALRTGKAIRLPFLCMLTRDFRCCERTNCRRDPHRCTVQRSTQSRSSIPRQKNNPLQRRQFSRSLIDHMFIGLEKTYWSTSISTCSSSNKPRPFFNFHVAQTVRVESPKPKSSGTHPRLEADAQR